MNNKLKELINKLAKECKKVCKLSTDIMRLILKVSSELVFKIYDGCIEKLYKTLEKIDNSIERRLGKRRYNLVVIILKIVKRFVKLIYSFFYSTNIIFEEIITEVDKATNYSYSKPQKDIDPNYYSVDWSSISDNNINYGQSAGIYHQVDKDCYEFDMYFDEDNQPVILNEDINLDIKSCRTNGKINFCKNIVDHIYNNKYSHRIIDQINDAISDNDSINHKVYERYRATFFEDNKHTVCLIEEYKRKEWIFITLLELNDIKNESDINVFNIEYDNIYQVIINKDYSDIIDTVIKSNIKSNKVNITDILIDIFNNIIDLSLTIFIVYSTILSLKGNLINTFSSLVEKKIII